MKFNLFKHIILCIFISGFINNLYSNPEPLNLIMLFSEGGIKTNEYTDPKDHAKPGALLIRLFTAIEDNIPVIASKPIIMFLCALAGEYGDISEHKSETSELAQDENISIRRDHYREKIMTYLKVIDIYLSKNNDFVFISPKDEIISGINYENLTKVNFNNLQDLAKKFNDDDRSKINTSDLDDILSDDKEINKNIYAIGHGSFIKDLAPAIKEDKIQTDINLERKKKRRRKHTNLAAIKPSIFLQMDFSEYKKMLSILNKKGCSFLLLSTCYGGGWNIYNAHKQENIKNSEEFNKKLFLNDNIQFPIVMFSVSDSISYGIKYRVNHLRNFFHQLNEFLENRKRDGVKDWVLTDSLKAILNQINLESVINTPLIWFPGNDQFFRVVGTSDKTETITFNSLINAELKRIYDPTHPDYIDIDGNKQVVLIYPQVIPFDLKINSRIVIPKFVSMIPGPSRHFIKSISFSDDNKFIFDDVLEAFGFYSTGYRSPFLKGQLTDNIHGIGIAPRLFFIKELKTSKVNYKNIMIKIKYRYFKNRIFVPETKVIYAAEVFKSRFIYFKKILLDDASFNKLPEENKAKYIERNPRHYYRQYKAVQPINYMHKLTKVISKEEMDKEIEDTLEEIVPNKDAHSQIVDPYQSDKKFKEAVRKAIKLKLDI